MTPTTALTSSLLHPQSESAAVPTNISSLTLTSIMACDYWSISITNNFTVDLAYITVFKKLKSSTKELQLLLLLNIHKSPHTISETENTYTTDIKLFNSGMQQFK